MGGSGVQTLLRRWLGAAGLAPAVLWSDKATGDRVAVLAPSDVNRMGAACYHTPGKSRSPIGAKGDDFVSHTALGTWGDGGSQADGG